jgi:uncharacterized membrane protein
VGGFQSFWEVDMSELVAVAYEDETIAARAAEELHRSSEELSIDPDASSVLVRERDGTCRLTTSCARDIAPDWSAFWGALLGPILGGEGEMTIEAPFRRRLQALLAPGSSVLLFATPDLGKERILDSLSHFGGRALSCRLAEDLSDRLNVRRLRLG